MEQIYIIKPSSGKLIDGLVFPDNCLVISDLPGERDFKDKRIVFAVKTDRFGNAPELYNLLEGLSDCAFEGSVGGIIVECDSDLHSKTLAAKILFDTNRMGLSFVGHPLVETTKSRKNFRHVKAPQQSYEQAFSEQCSKLLGRVAQQKKPPDVGTNIAVLHASDKNSNTLTLWGMIESHLSGQNTEIIRIDSGEIYDCKGCTFTVCKHYGEQHSCFYGGIITDEVFPAVLNADKIVLLCPNYNDALGANFSAMINRLTALYRKYDFYEKTVYAVIVSGFSGGDALAKQIISALNMNKGFFLPSDFAMLETANDRGEILSVPQIEQRAQLFAQKLMGK